MFNDELLDEGEYDPAQPMDVGEQPQDQGLPAPDGSSTFEDDEAGEITQVLLRPDVGATWRWEIHARMIHCASPYARGLTPMCVC